MDMVYASNIMHVTPWPVTVGIFRNVPHVLKENGYLVTYGPYMLDGVITPESNEKFNNNLKAQNPDWGLRDVRDLSKLAEENRLQLISVHDMLANNKMLFFRKVK